MPIPQSFIRAGFVQQPAKRLRRLMIGTEGESSSGKSEFISSAPGPGISLCLDRNYEAMLDNPHPPKSRNDDFVHKIIQIPLDTQANKNGYLEGWNNFKALAYAAIAIPECLTLGIDTDNASWELQTLAEFGKLTQIPPIMRVGLNAARRAFIARLSDSGKNIIASNMLKDEYKTVVDDEGNPVTKDGKEIQEKTGERKRQGFSDQNYLWQVQIRHLMIPPETKTVPKEITLPNGKVVQAGTKTERVKSRFGLKILKCTRNTELIGEELWDDRCNFAGLVQLIYPDVPLEMWGFK